MQYVPVPSPTSSASSTATRRIPGIAAGGNIAGVTALRLLEPDRCTSKLGGYGSARGIASFMTAGVAERREDHACRAPIRTGASRSAREWGAHNLMVGTSGMIADVYDDPLDTSDPTSVHHFRDIGVDAQYQYLLDPHAVTVQLAYMRDTHRVPAFLADQPVDSTSTASRSPNTNTSDHDERVPREDAATSTPRSTAAASRSSTRPARPTPRSTTRRRCSATCGQSRRSAAGPPKSFVTPVQYLRIGLQYTMYDRYNGASHNYDGAGRNASDNDSLFLYFWGAY